MIFRGQSCQTLADIPRGQVAKVVTESPRTAAAIGHSYDSANIDRMALEARQNGVRSSPATDGYNSQFIPLRRHGPRARLVCFRCFYHSVLRPYRPSMLLTMRRAVRCTLAYRNIASFTITAADCRVSPLRINRHLPHAIPSVSHPWSRAGAHAALVFVPPPRDIQV